MQTSIRTGNWRLLVTELARHAQYPLSDGDWDALDYGIRCSCLQTGSWYEYELYGASTASLSFARDIDRGLLWFGLSGPIPGMEGISALADILRDFDPGAECMGLLPVLRSAFPIFPVPKPHTILSCTPEHLASCLECQEVLNTFGGRTWVEVGQGVVPAGYADVNFHSADARRYCWPAYLHAALKTGLPCTAERANKLVDFGMAPVTVLQCILAEFIPAAIERKEWLYEAK